MTKTAKAPEYTHSIKPTTGMVGVATRGNRWREVEATIVTDLFAYFPSLTALEEGKEWTVLHRPTGRIVGLVATEKRALWLCRMMARLPIPSTYSEDTMERLLNEAGLMDVVKALTRTAAGSPEPTDYELIQRHFKSSLQEHAVEAVREPSREVSLNAFRSWL